jgi:hypothetical protein
MELEDVDESSKNIVIRDNTISNVKCFTPEYPVVVSKMNGKPINDARAAIFQFEDTFKDRDLALNRADGTYKGNIVSHAQILVAQAILRGIFPRNHAVMQNKINTIPLSIVRWAEGIQVGTRVPKLKPQYRCHGDSMHHFNKGIVGIRLEET